MTATWTITETNRGSSYPSATLATHTYTLTSQEFTNANGATSVTLSPPTLTVKYNTSANSRNGIWDNMRFAVSVGDVDLGYASSGLNTFNVTLSANTVKTATGSWNPSPVALDSLFTANNPTERSVPIKWKLLPLDSPLGMLKWAASGKNTSNSFETIGYAENPPSSLLSNTYQEGSIKLNAPPTFDVTTMSKDTSSYIAGITNVSVTVSNTTAYYGGNITSAKLTVGTQEATISGNGTISMMLQNTGTFTPSVTVTDSRGQTKTENLASITVIPYEKPSVDFDIFRTDEDGIKSDEGNYGVIAANLTYMGEVANLTEPTISINNTLLTNYYAKTLDTVVDNNKTYYTYSEGSYTVVINPIDADIDLYYEKASITWYLNYNSQTGVSTLITNWSQVGSNNTATIYGLVDACFAALESYQITFVETDSLNGQSEAIMQMLSTAFYTIDFQAGGKEIAFGAPANDDLTNINGTDYSDEGLFKCAMGTSFNDMEQTEVNQFISDLDISGSPIELTQADWVVEQGITGDWTWRKWQSGIAECWGMFLHNTTVSGAWGNGFLSNVKVINFPTDLFVSPPSGMSAYVDSTWAGLSACENQIATKDWMRCYVFRTSSTGTTAADFYIHIDAKGRWK